MHSLRHRRFVWEIMMNFTIYFTHTTNFITWRNCMLMKSFFSDILFNISAVKEWIIVIEGWCSFFFFIIVFLCFAFQFCENCHTVVFNLITIKEWTVAIEGYCLYPEIITIPFEGLCIVYGKEVCARNHDKFYVFRAYNQLYYATHLVMKIFLLISYLLFPY